MALEVHILGTSSARPSQGRSVSGSIVETPHGMVVIDCGEGFQNRLVKHRSEMKNFGGRRLKMSKCSAILLTHGHRDHTWGVLPWVQTMSLEGRNECFSTSQRCQNSGHIDATKEDCSQSTGDVLQIGSC